MLKPLKLLSRPEDQFVERYERLHAWALSLTNGDQEQADDLVHDAFVQFTLRRPELGTIENTDAYLNRMLRNMFLSQVRRSPKLQLQPESIADYDSAELGLRIIDPQSQVQIADELWRICQFASERKETSKTGSVLILRFFHGYYLNEIAQLLRSPMHSIYGYLKLARREAKLYLDNPSSLKLFIKSPIPIAASESKSDHASLLGNLRSSIFNSRRGACLAPAQLNQLYKQQSCERVDVVSVAHMVSCPICLDRVNHLLDLPLLADRYPTDTLGPDDGPRDDGDHQGPKQGGSGESTSMKRKHIRRFKEVFDHRPQELRVSVNGFVLGSQKVGQEINEQTITVNIDERIGFVEVFSEQGVRLIFCDVHDPVDGDIEQRSEVQFSDGRKLALVLNFRTTWPTLHVVYRDPMLKAVEMAPMAEAAEASAPSDPTISPPNRTSLFFSNANAWLWRFIRNVGFWLRPATVTALVAVLVAVMMFVLLKKSPNTQVSARDLLGSSIAAEDTIAANSDQVIHRTINLEVRRVGQSVNPSRASEVITRQKIEIWHSAAKGITARRLYDERGYLVSGDWRRGDGAQTLYHHGAAPRLRLIPEKRDSLISNFDDLWQLDPSAKEFAALMDGADRSRVEERPGVYLIIYEISAGSLVKAALTLSRSDLHATGLTLTFRQADEVREYTYLEASFERRPPTTVAPSVFEPERELLSLSSPGIPITRPEVAPVPQPLVVQPLASVIATPELEVEVLQSLSQAGADMGEQVNVTRTAEGRLRVTGVVETDERKTQILNALGVLTKNPAVSVEIQTAAEAVSRLNRNQPTASSIDLQRVEVTNSIPAGSDLRRYFGKQGVAADEEISRFSARVINLQAQAVSHAGAMRRLVNQFSPEELRTLQPEARDKWLRMIRAHALALKQETISLRRELQPIFFRSDAREENHIGVSMESDSDLVRTIQSLFELTASNYEVVRSAFSASGRADAILSLRSLQFWRSLDTCENQASAIAVASLR